MKNEIVIIKTWISFIFLGRKKPEEIILIKFNNFFTVFGVRIIIIVVLHKICIFYCENYVYIYNVGKKLPLTQKVITNSLYFRF